jgi:hypothetical protein
LPFNNPGSVDGLIDMVGSFAGSVGGFTGMVGSFAGSVGILY